MYGGALAAGHVWSGMLCSGLVRVLCTVRRALSAGYLSVAHQLVLEKVVGVEAMKAALASGMCPTWRAGACMLSICVPGQTMFLADSCARSDYVSC